MSLGSMANELTGCLPQLSFDYAKTIIRRSFQDVERKNLWSFLMVESNWTSPAVINTGTCTVTQGSSSVVFDATAAAVLNAIGVFPSTITQRQFRVGIGTIYNIWAWDGANTATLDRNYQEATASGSTYSIYQCYYPAPVENFWCWLSVRDIINFNDLITTKDRATIDLKDPQRSIIYIPTHVVPYGVDLNPNSSTYKWPMFELWGQPYTQLTYQLACMRKSWPLTANSDELPPQIGEDCVMALSEYNAYKWGELNWKPEWGSKPNFLAMMRELVDNRTGKTGGLFNRLFREYRMQDRAAVNNFVGRLRRAWSFPSLNGWYNSAAGVANPGAPW